MLLTSETQERKAVADGHSAADERRLRSAPGPSPSAMGISDEPLNEGSDAPVVAASAGQTTAAADVSMADAEGTETGLSRHSRAAPQADQEPDDGVWL